MGGLRGVQRPHQRELREAIAEHLELMELPLQERLDQEQDVQKRRMAQRLADAIDESVEPHYGDTREGIIAAVQARHPSATWNGVWRTIQHLVNKCQIHVDTEQSLVQRQQIFRPGAPPTIAARQPLTEGEHAVWQSLDGQAGTGMVLAVKLSTSPQTIKEHVRALRRKGYHVENVRSRGYYRPDSPPSDHIKSQLNRK